MPARRHAVISLLLAALLLLVSLPSASPAQAAKVVVHTAGDAPGATCPATCTLRAAIATAAPSDTITFAFGLASPIVLAQGELVINKNLTIRGPDGGTIAVDGNNASRVFSIGFGNPAAQVMLSNLTAQRGNGVGAVGPGFGGAIVSAAVLTLTGVAIIDNTAASEGGGMFSQGG